MDTYLSSAGRWGFLRRVEFGYDDNTGYTEKGKNGADGQSKYLPLSPVEIPMPSIPNLVNSYKEYVRANLMNDLIEPKLSQFVHHLDINKVIQESYNVIDYILEFECLERQFFRFRKDLCFETFFDVLLKRINEYKATHTVTEDNRKALNRLYAAIMSKFFAINERHGVVLDLSKFLKIIKTEINDLNKISNLNKIQQYRDDYKMVLDRKIELGQNLIKNHIEKQFQHIFTENNRQMNLLMKETIDQRENLEKNLNESMAMQEKLSTTLALRTILGGLKLAATAISVLGPQGAAIGTVAGGALMVFESAYVDKDISKPPALNPMFGKLWSKVGDTYKIRYQNIKAELDDLHSALQRYSNTFPEKKASLTQLMDEIHTTNNELGRINTESVPSTSNSIDDKTAKLKTSIERYINDLKKNEDKKYDQLTSRLNKCQTMVFLAEVGMDGLNRIRNDRENLKIVDASIEKIRNEIAIAKEFEKKIYNAFIPMLKGLGATVIDISKNLTGKSQIELDIAKWNIQNTLREVKHYFNRITEPFKMHDGLQLLFDNLIEGMNTLINIYDRFQTYSDQAKFAHYLADISMSGSDNRINDDQLNRAITNIDELRQINVFWEHYQRAIKGLKLHVFPFAERYLAQFKLPNDLLSDDIQELKQTAIAQIEKLDTDIGLTTVLRENFHNDIVSGEFSVDSPFYVWKHNEIQNDLNQLFRGKSLIIKANINRAFHRRNAIKFRRIELLFQPQNEHHQKELYKVLSDFDMQMVMVGDHYYRCDDKIFSIAIDDYIEFYFTIEADPTQKPKMKSGSYELIERNDYFLSPYAIWNITLFNERKRGDFSKLQRFIDEPIDLTLMGDGQYLKHGFSSSDICSDKLNEYYDIAQFD